MNDKLKEPLPKSVKEVPSYLWRLISKFTYRLFYIFGLVWETKPWILFVMLFMAIFDGVTPVINAYIGAALLNALGDSYTGSATFNAVMVLLILQFTYIFIVRLINSINNILSRISGELVVNYIKIKIMNKAREVDIASFDMPDFYERFENADREAGNRPIQVMNATFGIMSSLISMVSFIVILAAVSPFAPWLIIAMSIPSAIISFIYRRKNFRYMRHRSKDRRQLNYYSSLMTNKDMVKEIRMFGLADTLIKRYKDTFDRYFAGLKKLFVSEGAWNIAMTLVTSTVNCVLFLFIAKGVSEGQFKIGDYSLYTGALNSIASGVASLISTTATIYEGTLFIDNMILFMAEKKRIVSALPVPVKVERHIGHTVEFQNVSFRYPGTKRDVIKNVSVKLDPGETVVLVGLNGAGKTTLIKLLTRLYDPTEGCILLDGRDLCDYDPAELYKIFGIIFQDFGKYAVTVSENIAFGQIEKPVDPEAIKTAAIQSNADGFIEKLTDKYNTPLMRYFEDNGIELSIGQWQKLAVARAFYGDSDILILDEPTASLDAIAEQEIFNQFDELRKNKTTIFVSHRLSSATTASKIIVLENGEVVEVGRHAELMKNRGRYHELFSTQAKRYITNSDESIFGAQTEPSADTGGVTQPEAENQYDSLNIPQNYIIADEYTQGGSDRKPPQDGRPHGGHPQGERPQGGPPTGGRPQGERPQGEPPTGEHPHNSSPSDEKLKIDTK
jgi:ABC-type multidrug transport system, ATPase and permease components